MPRLRARPSTLDRIPDQTGRIALVTGGSRGLGLDLARALAGRGATVLIAGRDEESGDNSVASIRRQHPGSDVEFVQLDLADPASIQDVAASLATRSRLDLLINNAGLMAPPLSFAPSGYETQWATNVFGPFALTARLLPLVTGTAGSRIVTVSSIAHLMPPFTIDSARLEVQGSGHRPFLVYGHTKLADLLITRELDRRLRAVGSSTIAVAAHPGVAGTDIAAAPFSWAPKPVQDAAVAVWAAITPTAAQGMESILAAAIAPVVHGGDVIGPRGLAQTRGIPGRVWSSPASRDARFAGELVSWLEQVTGLRLAP